MRASKREISAALLIPFLSLVPSKKGLTVLTFHNMYPQQYAWFDYLLGYITKHYQLIDPLNLRHNLKNQAKKPEILLTFDDGFLSNKILAEQILSKYGAKAIFFITEGFIGLKGSDTLDFVTKNFYPNSKDSTLKKDSLEPMTWDDVKWLSKNGHMIGAHTKSHPMLSLINDNDSLTDEIISSADRIEEIINTKVNCFAFPFGHHTSVNKEVVEMAKKRFEFSFSNIRGNLEESPGKQFIFRQNMVPDDPIWLSKTVIEGKLDWKYSKSRRLAREIYSA